MSFLTGTGVELLYANTAISATQASWTTETLLNTTASMGVQARIPPDFWGPTPNSVGRGIRIVARGIAGVSSSACTFTFNVRGGASGSTTSPILLGVTSPTSGTNVTNVHWEFDGTVILTQVGAAGGNSTVNGVGTLLSNFVPTSVSEIFSLYAGASSPGTITIFDTSITNYINFNVACSVSNAANTLNLHQLLVYGLN